MTDKMRLMQEQPPPARRRHLEFIFRGLPVKIEHLLEPEVSHQIQACLVGRKVWPVNSIDIQKNILTCSRAFHSAQGVLCIMAMRGMETASTNRCLALRASVSPTRSGVWRTMSGSK
jgi:hypothetical protein